jgi:hypothetical protein
LRYRSARVALDSARKRMLALDYAAQMQEMKAISGRPEIALRDT